MAGKTAILSLKIIGDATSAQKAAAQTKEEISGLERAMGKVSKPAALAGAAAGAALMTGVGSALNADKINRQMAAALDLDPAEAEAAGRITGDLYTAGFGGSMEEVAGIVDGVASTLADMSTNGGADVDRLSEKALNLAATFPAVGDGIEAVGALVKTGLATSADEGYDLLAGALNKVPAAMREEMIPTIQEYSQYFGQLGIDGTTAMGILINASEGGAISLDKTGDALKELTIRATDGSAATAEAMEAIGSDAGEMASMIALGGKDAQLAFAEIVHGLQGIEDPAKQAQAAVALFGTPLEDLGTDQIPAFLGAIDPAGDAFDSLAGSAERMGETINAGPSVALESLKRTALDSFTQIGAAALPILEPVIGQLERFAPILGPAAVAVAGLAGMVWLVNGAMAAWNAVQAVGRGLIIATTAAQWLWNAAMTANPIGAVIALVAALTAGIIWAYNNVGWFRDGINAMGGVGRAVFDALVAGVQKVINWLDNVLGPVGGIEGAMNALKLTAGAVFGSINTAIQGTIGWVKDAIGWFKGLFGAKNDAASVDAGGPAAASARTLAAPMTMMAMATPMTLAADPAPQFRAGPAEALVDRIGALDAERSNDAGGVHNEFNITIETGVGDPVAIGREIDKVLKKYRKTIGGGSE